MKLTLRQLNDFSEKVKGYLERSKITEALDDIDELITKLKIEELENDLIGLKARAIRIKDDETKGLEVSSVIRVEWNKITHATYELLKASEEAVKVDFIRKDLQESYVNLNVATYDEDGGLSLKEWTDIRKSIYTNSERVFLVHTLWPSKKENQEFDIYIYLKGHKSVTLEDISHAEFFLGHHWENKIFKAKNKNNRIGIYTSAYGPFQCVCKISFKDGREAIVHRYIDFEQGRLLKEKEN